MNSDLYDRDFYAWANRQAALLRAGDFSAADMERIALEIESMGKAEKRELVSRLKILLLHLLKWRRQPALRGRSWRLSIEEQRREVAEHLDDNPSLRGKLPHLIASAYAGALIRAEQETGLARETFPPECPFTFEQMMDDGFWPE